MKILITVIATVLFYVYLAYVILYVVFLNPNPWLIGFLIVAILIKLQS